MEDGAANLSEKTHQKHQNSIKLYEMVLTENGKRRNCAHQKHAKQQNYYLYSQSFLQKTYSDMIPSL